MLPCTWLERLSRGKHSSLFGPFSSFDRNEVSENAVKGNLGLDLLNKLDHFMKGFSLISVELQSFQKRLNWFNIKSLKMELTLGVNLRQLFGVIFFFVIETVSILQIKNSCTLKWFSFSEKSELLCSSFYKIDSLYLYYKTLQICNLQDPII